MIMTGMMNYTIFSEVNTLGTLFQYLETKLATAKFFFFLSRKKCCIIQIAPVSESQDYFFSFKLLLTEVRVGLEKSHFNLLSLVFVLTSPTSLWRRNAVVEHNFSLLFCTYTKPPFSLKVNSGKNNLKYSGCINLLTQDSNIIGLFS